MQRPEEETDEFGPDTEINPLYVRHQLCLESLNGLLDMENISERIASTLCGLSAFYDGVSGDVLESYFDHVGIPYVDPVVERECKEVVNAFHAADLVRIVEPGEDRWIDPENAGAFRSIVDDEFSSFLTETREQSRQFRKVIEESIQEYLATHD